MEKLKLNNQIIKMKIPIKKAIRRVYQKLKKNEEKLKNLNSKSKNEKKINKLERQVKKCENEEKILKTISPEEIAKLALVLPCTNLKNLLNCDELNLEEKIKLKIVLTDIVKKLVETFFLELPGSEQWIDVTIDLIDIKKIIKSYKNKELVKKLDKQLKQRRNILRVYKRKNGIKDNENEIRNQNKLEIKKVIKRINLDKTNNEVFIDFNDLITETIENKELADIELENVKDNNILDVINAKLQKEEISEDENSIASFEDNNSIASSEDNNSIASSENKCLFKKEKLASVDVNSELSDKSFDENDSKSDCGSIDSCKYDNFVNNNSDKNLELTEYSDEEDIVMENIDEDDEVEETIDEELVEDSEIDEKNNEAKNNFEENISKNADKDVNSESQKYLESQLVKVFGEKLAKKKPTEDVSSDEEIIDDFFINKTVKKYKPTKADLIRYKDLKNKEISHKNRNNENEEADEFPKKQSEEEKLFKTKNSQKNMFNTQFSSRNQPKKQKTNDTHEALHPSWEAKKKMKTSLKIDLSKTNNKKIIFD